MKLLTTMTLLSTVAVHSATVTYLFGEVDFSSNEISTSSSSAFVEAGADEEVELFALGDVRLTGGPFQWAQHSNTEYLHSLDPDRLMSLMRRGAGLAPKSNQHYGGWDNWGSTAAGGYLSACAMTYASTGDERMLERANYMVDEMRACQNAWGDGSLNVNAAEKSWFDKLAAGNLETRAVVPWYQVHKILAGLLDARQLAHNQTALDALVDMCDWAIETTSALSEQQWQDMLAGEHGGPHEVFADVYAITGEEKYLTLAKKFKHSSVFNPMRRSRISGLYGLHGNTQIPKFAGYQRISEVGAGGQWHEAADNFYGYVTQQLSWPNASNTQSESFFPRGDFPERLMINCGAETCNTYNMLKLTRMLYASQPKMSEIDFCENALYNHLLPATDPANHGYVYYTPLKPGHYRVFSTQENSFWCCVVTGIKNPARYGDMIYAHGSNSVYVNMFIPSTLSWEEKGLTLTQQTDIPADNTSIFTLELLRDRRFSLNLRYPHWAESAAVKVNDSPVAVEAENGSYIELNRYWKTGDRIDLSFGISVRCEFLPASEDYISLFYGPVMLAGALGACELADSDFFGGGINDQAPWKDGLWSDVPVLMGNPDEITAGIARDNTKSLAFSTAGVSKPSDAALLPFYKVRRERYVACWPVASESTYPQVRSRMDAEDARTIALRSAIDRVDIAISTASETAHNLQGTNLDIGGLPGQKWRAANSGGWLSYDCTVSPQAPVTIVAKYWGNDGGARSFDISVDGTVIAGESLSAEKPGSYVYHYYPVPAGLTLGKNSVNIKLDAADDNTAGGLFGLWVISTDWQNARSLCASKL